MTEVARGLVLPGIMRCRGDTLLSMLLVWEGVEFIGSQHYDDDDSPEAEQFRRLKAEGLVSELQKSTNEFQSLDEMGQRWLEMPWEKVLEKGGASSVPEVLGEAVDHMLQVALAEVGKAVEVAEGRGLAPIAPNAFATKAASLPTPDSRAPLAEATLIQAASQAARVSPGCQVEDLLAFRERNRAAMGRFRAALVDLASSIQADTPASAAEQARATVLNRVEPALANLEHALAESRFRFTWNTMVGASALIVGAPLGGPAAIGGAGSLFMQGLRYSFDRDRLVADHPYGLLLRVSQEFGQSQEVSGVSVDPVAEMKAEMLELVENIARVALDEPPPQPESSHGDPDG
jgi:hypothetical protein